MTKKVLFAAGAIIVTAVVSVFVHLKIQDKRKDALFNANVEALSQSEIIVGPLCMEEPNRACTSLNEVIEGHIKAY